MNTTIRDIDDWVLGELKQQAAASGRSQQGYIKHVLCEVAKTPLPLDRNVLFDLLKEPVRLYNRAATELHVTGHGEFLRHLFWDGSGYSPTTSPPEIVMGLRLVIVRSLPPHVHAKLVGDWGEVEVTTELIWKLAGQVKQTIQFR